MKQSIKNIYFILFFVWIIASFSILYYFLTSGGGVWFSMVFLKFSAYLLSVSFVWLGLIYTSGKFKDVGRHLKKIIVILAILLVVSFTVIKWTDVTTSYGSYDAPKAGASERFLFQYHLSETNSTPFERELLYQGGMLHVYDKAFKQIWTFGMLVFTSVFLILKILPKKDE